MKILLNIEDLTVGGAQVFVLRLGQALRERGHEVHIYSHYAHHTDAAMVRQLAPGIAITAFGSGQRQLDYLMRKAEGALRRFGIRPRMREQLVIAQFKQLVKRLRPAVINSHTIKADYAAAMALTELWEDGKPAIPPLIITMHGCYELFLHYAEHSDVTARGLTALQQAAAFVYLTEKNLEIFSQPDVRPLAQLPHRKIYNGFSGQLSTQQGISRQTAGISDSATVFGMVARGIPEKGWEFAIKAFLEVAAEHDAAHLILVGGSDYLTGLQARYAHPRLHFVGRSSNPVDWINLFDVGLLPSYFHAESLPNSIAEYLFCGKPVIASSIGEVPQMLTSPTGLAGVIIDQANWQLTNPDQLTEAMRAYLVRPALLAEHSQRAGLAFEKFEMARCVQAYEQLFTEAGAA